MAEPYFHIEPFSTSQNTDASFKKRSPKYVPNGSPLYDANNNPITTATDDETLPSWTWEEVKWRNVILLTLFHGLAIYGLYLYVSGALKWQTVLLGVFYGILSGQGITLGAHRLWCHRSFKAKWPLRLLLAFCNTIALETDIYDWCRDHRVHHKFSETNADPHDSRRGFFFSHVGWLLLRKHPDVLSKGRTVDLSDILADPIVRFQRRYYLPLSLLCWGLLPTYMTVYLLDEPPLYAFLYVVMFRYMFVMHSTWLVNSWAHMFGTRPYNVRISPTESRFVAYLSYGEGYHNYHHAFPNDAFTSELGFSETFSLSTTLLTFFATIGWAYDIKRPSPEMIHSKMAKDGDGSHPTSAGPSQLLLDCFLALFFFPFFSFLLRLIVTLTVGLYNIC